MGGGLMQLVAYGAQDIYLTGNPQITFFKVVYRRHTNFSMEAIMQTWNGSNTGASGRSTATISRNGDLVGRMYLEVDLTVDTAPVADITAAGIKSIEVEIGGQKIDKHTGKWMDVWSKLSEVNPSGHTGGGETVDGGTLFQNMSGMGGAGSKGSEALTYFVPLQFWFCRNPGLALPLIALQYHEVKVILEHDFGGNGATSAGLAKNNLWADYIYLDTDERRRFAQVSHEYLIEQVQDATVTPQSTSELNFNHPVKELIWCAAGADTLGTAKATVQLKLNGHDRFAERDWRYFTRTQVWQHHTGAGGLTWATADGVGNDDSIGVYSFALKPEEHQPSGTCNFSRIDNAQLVQSTGSKASKVWAVNYNVLRIMSGMGGLAYSN